MVRAYFPGGNKFCVRNDAARHFIIGIMMRYDTIVNSHIPHQVFVGVEKGVYRHSLDFENLASISKGFSGYQGRSVCTWRLTGCFHDIQLSCCILVPQRTCQIGFGAILGVTEQTFHIRFVGVGIFLLCHQGVVQVDGYLFDRGANC